MLSRLDKYAVALPALCLLGALAAAAPLAGEESLSATSAIEKSSLFPDDSRQWSRASEARILADLSRAQPAAVLTTGRREPGKWKVIHYAAGEIEGHALWTLRATESPTVSLPLDASGWHAVYLGVCTVSGGLDKSASNAVRVKLSGDEVFRRMANGMPLLKPRRDVIQEIFLTAADLTGQSLEIASLPFKSANVCYVKLVPLSDEEANLWQQPRANDGTRTQIATFDGHSWIWPYRRRTEEHLRETFRGFERSDVGKWWCPVLGADLTCYPTEVGNIPGEGTQDFSACEYKEYTESLRAMFAAGVHPLKVAREEAAQQGVEFHVMIRRAGRGGCSKTRGTPTRKRSRRPTAT